MQAIQGALIDVDGTLLVGDAAIPGAADALARLRTRGIPFRLTTNTTRRSRAEVAAALTAAGIPAREAGVVAPSGLARRHVLASGRTRALLLVPGRRLRGITPVKAGRLVIVADLGPGFTLSASTASAASGGADLIAHRNPWCFGGVGTRDGRRARGGAEYASGATGLTVGSPRAFFDLALAELELARGVLVVGTRENDCRGGQEAGCLTALVRTGKPFEAGLARLARRPDLVVDSIADLW
jgi:ribonucleotide monophosphatase NagD (HAD superfamily)